MGLSSHINVWNSCLRVLRQRGFALWVDGEPSVIGSYPDEVLWIARKNGFHFCADNPIELLGLVAVHDYVQPGADVPYWWQVEGPDIYTELMEAAFPEAKDAG